MSDEYPTLNPPSAELSAEPLATRADIERMICEKCPTVHPDVSMMLVWGIPKGEPMNKCSRCGVSNDAHGPCQMRDDSTKIVEVSLSGLPLTGENLKWIGEQVESQCVDYSGMVEVRIRGVGHFQKGVAPSSPLAEYTAARVKEFAIFVAGQDFSIDPSAPVERVADTWTCERHAPGSEVRDIPINEVCPVCQFGRPKG